jgi:hypothetical protein
MLTRMQFQWAQKASLYLAEFELLLIFDSLKLFKKIRQHNEIISRNNVIDTHFDKIMMFFRIYNNHYWLFDEPLMLEVNMLLFWSLKTKKDWNSLTGFLILTKAKMTKNIFDLKKVDDERRIQRRLLAWYDIIKIFKED